MIAFPLLAAPLGRRAALLAAVFLAISPVAVAYSRLGWDPSGSPLLTLVAIGCALHDKPVAAVLSLAIAYLVHPTNIFVAPVVAAAWAPHAVARYRQATDEHRARLVRIAVAGVIIAIPIGVWALIRIAANPETPLPSVSMVIDRMFSPAMWLGRMWGAAGLLSGITSAVYIGGPLSSTVVGGATAIAAAALLLPVAFGWRAFRDHRHALWLLAGLTVTFAGFHIVAVPAALNPGLERYALFLLVPLVIVTAVGHRRVDQHADDPGHADSRGFRDVDVGGADRWVFRSAGDARRRISRDVSNRRERAEAGGVQLHRRQQRRRTDHGDRRGLVDVLVAALLRRRGWPHSRRAGAVGIDSRRGSSGRLDRSARACHRRARSWWRLPGASGLQR